MHNALNVGRGQINRYVSREGSLQLKLIIYSTSVGESPLRTPRERAAARQHAHVQPIRANDGEERERKAIDSILSASLRSCSSEWACRTLFWAPPAQHGAVNLFVCCR